MYEVTKSCHCVVITLSLRCHCVHHLCKFHGRKTPLPCPCTRFAKASLTNPSLIEYSECTRKCTKSPRVVIVLSSPVQASWAQGSASLLLRTFCQGRRADQSVLERILGMHTKVYEVIKSCHCVVIICASFMGARLRFPAPAHVLPKTAGLTNPSLIEYSECTRKCTKSPRVVIALSSPVQASWAQNPTTLLLRTFCQDRRADQSVLDRILGMHTKVYEVTKSCHCAHHLSKFHGRKTPPRCPCASFAKASLTNPSLIEYSECTRRCTKSPRVVIELSSPEQVSCAQNPATLCCHRFAKAARVDQSVLDRILGMHTKVYEVIKSCHCVVTTCANFMGAKPRHAVLSSFCQRSQELSNPSLIEYSECTRKCTKSPRVVIALSLCCHHGLPDSPKSLKVFR